MNTLTKKPAKEVLSEALKPQIQTSRVSGAEAVILSLIAEGVEVMFGYPGGAIMPVYDELYKYQDKIQHILSRHEQGSVHSAQGYARISQKVGVCIATSGPGATNLVTGLADALIDSTPIVCITGQVASHLLGTDAFQETDVVGITSAVTKWNFQVAKAEDIPTALAKAFYIARSGRPGPVLIDITKDAQFAQTEFNYKPCEYIASYHPVPKIQAQAIQAAADLINQAKKPLLLWGQGILLAKAEEEMQTLIEKTGIPAASTVLGLSALSCQHPLYVGMLGMHGNYAPNIKTNEADLLIAVGMRFDDRVTGDVKRYAKQAKIIHIEIDPAEINKVIPADVAVLGDAKEALQALIPLVNSNSHPEWLQEFEDAYHIEFQKVIKDEIHPDLSQEQIKMAEVINMISEKTKGQAVIVTDVGQHQMVASRYYKFDQSLSYVTSGGLGTMGFALPAAFGAKVARPDREVIAIIGDGGFQMTIQELGTIFQTGLNLKIVILNNHFLGMVRQWQQLFFEKRYSFTEMVNPDFIGISKSYGIDAQKVSLREDLEAAVEKMLASEQPFLLEVEVEKEENVFPMIPTGESVANIRLS
ncbi:MAG: biosynthetic-type acetolactate synthase large subunit [Microscillaceae bacterium]|nr:biosynthetic-type acetolactate synthase large subunit [Microscillaceae bacterium]